MFADKRKIRRTSGMFLSNKLRDRTFTRKGKEGYLELFLGKDMDNKPIFLAAHRFICWAYHGPPPYFSKDQVVEHTCDKSTCLNPLHLKYGEKRSNNKRNRVIKRVVNRKKKVEVCKN